MWVPRLVGGWEEGDLTEPPAQAVFSSLSSTLGPHTVLLTNHSGPCACMCPCQVGVDAARPHRPALLGNSCCRPGPLRLFLCSLQFGTQGVLCVKICFVLFSPFNLIT